MIVVGGTYREVCARPTIRRLRGSGLRAALTLRSLGTDVVLQTSVTPAEEREAAAVLTPDQSPRIAPIPRNMPVTFTYFTPVSPPVIDGESARMEGPIAASNDAVLRFSFLEQALDVRIQCRTLIVDPQGQTASLPIDGVTYERLAVVANEREVRRLGGDSDEIEAAMQLRAASGADVVIVKCGARGCIVVARHSITALGAYPTDEVHAIGSGDVFSGAFAHAYATQGMDAIEAADLASRYTAEYVNTGDERALGGPSARRQYRFGPRVPVYLAAPFFGLSQLWLVDLVRQSLIDAGAVPFSPFHDVGLGGPEVAQADLDGLDRCDAVLALVDDMDAGTIFEIGYAIRSEKPVVAYLDPLRSSQLTMLEGSGVEVTSDLATAIYRAIWRGMTAHA